MPYVDRLLLTILNSKGDWKVIKVMSHDYLYPMAIWGLFKRIQLDRSIRRTSSSNSSLKREVAADMYIGVIVFAKEGNGPETF